MPSEAKKIANAKYDKKTTRFIGLKLNRNTDADILQYLEQAENLQGTIKEALREYMKRTEA